MAAYYELVALAGFTHARPDWDVDAVEVGGDEFAVVQGVATATPFCELRHFRKEGGEDDPKVLLVAPMSGHFATLLRGTLRTLLRDHQVYVTDWINPRNVKLGTGTFGLDDYTQHLIDFVRSHRRGLPHRRRLPADGQRAGRDRSAWRRRAQYAAREPDADGRSDRHARLADQGQRTCAGEADRMVPRQPDRHRAGAIRGRRAPGLSRLSAALRFMSMNAERHAKSFVDLFQHRVAGDIEKADAIQRLLSANISPSWT